MGFRSHDFYGAYSANAYGLSRLLEYIANGAGLKVGSLTTVSVNAHYNRLFEKDVFGIVNFK
jgi:thymidylate synthase